MDLKFVGPALSWKVVLASAKKTKLGRACMGLREGMVRGCRTVRTENKYFVEDTTDMYSGKMYKVLDTRLRESCSCYSLLLVKLGVYTSVEDHSI